MSKNANRGDGCKMNKRLIATFAVLLLLVPTIAILTPRANALPTPTTFSVGGYTFYRWHKSGASQAVIVFYGGAAYPSGYVISVGYDRKAPNNKAWVEELWNFGFAVIAPKDDVAYSCTGSSVSSCSAWPHQLRNTVAGWYSRVEVFGHSAGAVIVGAEIIRYSDYPAAAMVSGLVDNDAYPWNLYFLFQSAHSAASDKSHTRLEYGSGDPQGMGPMMNLYRTNAYYGSGKIIMWDFIGGNMHNGPGSFFEPGPGDVYRAYVKTFLWQYG
jgi:hypothetical protein